MENTEYEVFQNHLLSVCTALGSYEQASEQWVPGDEALDCLRDLKRFLRADERQGERRCRILLGKWKVIQSDLLPLLQWAVKNEQWKLGMSTCEILVPLTWPLDAETDIKDMNALRNDLLEYKDVFVGSNAFQYVLALMINGLQTPFRERSENEHSRLKLLLLLLRNIVCIQDPQDAISGSSELAYRSTLQEKLIQQLQNTDFLQFLLSLTGSLAEEEFASWNMLAQEIVYYIFHGRNPEELIPQKKESSGKKLEELLKKEILAKARTTTTRHSRFGGAYTINLQSGRRVTTHKLPTSVSKVLDEKKTLAVRRQGGKKVVQHEKVIERRINDSQAKQCFMTFAESFVENSFNGLISSIKRDFDFERPNVVESNHAQFIWIIDFFLTYWNLRQPDLPETYLASVLNVQFTTYLMKYMSRYMDEKKLASLHSTVRTLRSLLRAIDYLKKSTDVIVIDLADQLQRSLFYDETNIRILCMLCKDPGLFSVPFAMSVVTTVDIFVAALEEFSTKDSFVVVKRSKVKDAEKPQDEPDTYESEEEEYENERISEREFRFEVVEKAFAYESVVQYYFRLLESYETLDLATMKAVFSMFNRIAVNCKLTALFFRPSCMYVLNQIVGERAYRSLEPEKYALVQQFTVLVMEAFAEAFQRNHLVVLESLYPKKRSDCYRIQFGHEPEPEITLDDESDSKPKHVMISTTAPKDDRLAIAIHYAAEKEKTDQLTSLRANLQELLRAEDEAKIQEICLQIASLLDHPEIELILEELDFDVEKKEFGEKTDFIGVIDLITDALAGELPYHDSVDYFIVPKRNKKRSAKKNSRRDPSKSSRKVTAATERRQQMEEQKYKSEKFVFDSEDEMDDDSFFAREADLRKRNIDRYGPIPTLKIPLYESLAESQMEENDNAPDASLQQDASHDPRDDKMEDDKMDSSDDSIFASDEDDESIEEKDNADNEETKG